MNYKRVLGIVPTIQAAQLLKEVSKKPRKKEKEVKLAKDATKIIVGVNLIKVESDLIKGL